MIRYSQSLEGLSPESFQGFFVGWPNVPSAEQFWRALGGAYALELAIEDEDVVGFAYAISDGHLCAFIPLVEVLPEWQGRGIGSEMVGRLLARLQGLYAVDLVCDESRVGFYKRLGLSQWTAMIQRNRGALRG